MRTNQIYNEQFGFIQTPLGKTYFKRILSGKKRTPVVCLHGGPGASHFLMLDLVNLAKDRDVILYDQIGCGFSDRKVSKKKMTIATYIQELETLRKKMNLSEMILLGHSWGSMLAMDYYLKYPNRIEKLIFSSPCLSSSLWYEDAKRLIYKLPVKTRKAIAHYEKKKTVEHPKYLKALKSYYIKHVFGKIQMDTPNMMATAALMNKDIYERMWGPHEFQPTGILRNYERMAQLNKIKVPVLFTCGQHDESTPESLTKYSAQTSQSKMHVFKNAAHMPFLSNTPEYLKVMRKFMRS